MNNGSSDLYLYIGEIDRKGYAQISDLCLKKKNDNAILALVTHGGDPHAGFRIARALQHHYGSFKVMIPMECKSAGTLLCIGASELIMGHRSELGPLDIQVRKRDELFDRGSGLDILQSLNYMQAQAMHAFRASLVELTRDAGLSTKMASEISSNLATGLFAPVYAQVDPIQLGEMQRAMAIAIAYGALLEEVSGNILPGAMAKLVTDYPAHAFVIDRKEAKTLFRNVRAPDGAEELAFCKKAYDSATNRSPNDLIVTSVQIEEPVTTKGADDAKSEAGSDNVADIDGRSARSQSKVGRLGEDVNKESVCSTADPRLLVRHKTQKRPV